MRNIIVKHWFAEKDFFSKKLISCLECIAGKCFSWGLRLHKRVTGKGGGWNGGDHKSGFTGPDQRSYFLPVVGTRCPQKDFKNRECVWWCLSLRNSSVQGNRKRENLCVLKPASSSVVRALTWRSWVRPPIRYNKRCRLWVPWRVSMAVCSSGFSSNACSDFKRKYFPKPCSFPGSRICMLWLALGLFHLCCHMLSGCQSVVSFLLWWQRALYSSAVFTSPSLLFSSDHQIRFFLIASGCGGTISKVTISAFDTKAVQQCDLPR